MVLGRIVCLEADVRVWKVVWYVCGGMCIDRGIVWSMLCLGVLHVGVGIVCMWGVGYFVYVWEGIEWGVWCLWVVVVCVCSTCGGMGGCVEVTRRELLRIPTLPDGNGAGRGL